MIGRTGLTLAQKSMWMPLTSAGTLSCLRKLANVIVPDETPDPRVKSPWAKPGLKLLKKKTWRIGGCMTVIGF